MEMKVKYLRSRRNAKQTSFTSPTGANVVSKSMRDVA